MPPFKSPAALGTPGLPILRDRGYELSPIHCDSLQRLLTPLAADHHPSAKYGGEHPAWRARAAQVPVSGGGGRCPAGQAPEQRTGLGGQQAAWDAQKRQPPIATDTLPPRQVVELEPAGNDKYKVRLTDGKETVAGLLASQVGGHGGAGR